MDRDARACRHYLFWRRCRAGLLRELAGARLRILRRQFTRGSRA